MTTDTQHPETGASAPPEGQPARRLPVLSDGGELRREVAEGLRYAHGRANANTSKLIEVTAFAYAAIELLAEKGLLSTDQLDARKTEVSDRLVERFRAAGMGAAFQDPELDKYEFKNTVVIDCENRVHLCKAACCHLRFALSRQDVEEGVVEWDFSHPYFIAQDESGCCRHLDQSALRCTIHAQRPLPCRAYDCRNDKRIWADFEARIPSPDLPKILSGEPVHVGADKTMP
jgi:Fe-S-cluster containining protein